MLAGLNGRLGHYLLLMAAGGCLFLVNLGGPALWDIDEGRNATAALEMHESGRWVVPTFNGQLRSHKPALLYWLQAAAYHFFGINEFAARLPSAFAALLTLLVVYELGRSLFNPSSGLGGGLVLASSVFFCVSAHFANPDALLLLFTTATLTASWLALRGARVIRWWLVAAGACSGLAMLAKGPVGVVLPLAVVGMYLVWSWRLWLLWDRGWLQAALMCGLVALPWYVLVTVDTKREFLTEFLLTHNLERALSPMEDHRGPPFYYVVVLMFGMLPWSIFLGSATWCGFWSAMRQPWHGLRGLWHAARDAETPDIDPTAPYRFLWCWLLVYLMVFTVAATKLPNYILPAYPPLALLMARMLDRWQRGLLRVPRWLQPLSLSLLVGLGVLTTVGLLVASGKLPVAWLRGRYWPGLGSWAFLGAVPLLGAVAAGWCLWHGRRTAFLLVIHGVALGFVGLIAGGASMALDGCRAPRPLVAEAGALQRDQEIRIGCYQLEHLPSLNFYVQRNVQYQQSDQEVLAFLRSPQPGFLFLGRADWERLSPSVAVPYRVLGRHREMYRSGEVVVIANH